MRQGDGFLLVYSATSYLFFLYFLFFFFFSLKYLCILFKYLFFSFLSSFFIRHESFEELPSYVNQIKCVKDKNYVPIVIVANKFDNDVCIDSTSMNRYFKIYLFVNIFF